jgi:hypothetical protein
MASFFSSIISFAYFYSIWAATTIIHLEYVSLTYMLVYFYFHALSPRLLNGICEELE